MIILRSSQTANDAPLAAVTYTTNLGIPPIIRLVAEPLIEAESLSLDTFGLKETTRHNCGFTPKRAAGFPAWPILTDPGNAKHALNLVKDVEWARRKAKTEAGKVKKRIDELVTTLQSSAPHFLPTFLEEIARIFADAGNLSYAKQYFGKARDVERAHDLAIDQARHAQAFVEFARMGLVTAKVFSQEARDASKRLEPEEAYLYFFNLVITQAESGAETYSKILTDLKFLGKAAGLSERQIQEEFTAAYVPTRSFATSPDAVLAVVLRTLPEIVATHPELQEALYSIIPAQWHDVTNYVDNLHKLGLWEPLASNPERFRQWIADITAHGNKKWRFFDATNLELLRAIDRNHAALAGLHISTHSNKYHPDYLDALIAAGVEWSTIPPSDEAEAQFMMSAWISKHHRDLAHLVAQEEYRSWFLRGLADLNISRHATVLLSGEPIRTVIRWKLEEMRDGQTKARGSHPEWLRLNWHASRVSSSRLRAYFPELIAQLLSVDPAAELAERLRRGTLVEYTWPEFEENAADFINQDTSISAVFPFVTAVNGKKVRIFSGASVRDCEIPVENVDTLVPTDDDVFVAYTNYTANGWDRWWLWLSDPQPHLITAPPSYSYENTGGEYATTVDGILHIGPAPITAGELDSDPKGVQLGFGPVYAANNAHAQSFTVLPTMAKITTAALNKQFAAGTLQGLEFPEAAALAAEHGAQLSFGDSFSAPAVTSTVDSPFGLDDGRHFALVLETESSGAYVVSPLGTFHSADESFLAIKQPHSGVWFLRKSVIWAEGTTLYDATTDAQISPSLTSSGTNHILHRLPRAGFHHLKVRNETASTRLRECTTKQAAALISDPLRILEFADNDVTLAAAITGIIVEVGKISGVELALPELDEVPEWLQFLYTSHAPHIVRDTKKPVGSKTHNMFPSIDVTETTQPKKAAAVKIPNPPDIRPHMSGGKAVVSMHKLATILNNPQESGAVHFPEISIMVRDTIGREKIWLSWLACPGQPLERVRLFHAFLSWCAQNQVLGTWRRATLASDSPKVKGGSRWDNKRILVNDYELRAWLWNPALTEPPHEPPQSDTCDDELFVPKDEFQTALDKILAWHENRHATGTHLTPAWGTTTIAAKATAAAEVSTLPPQMWACFFTAGYSEKALPFQEDCVNLAAEILKLPKVTVSSFDRNLWSTFHDHHREILGMAWHDDYLNTGPAINGIRAVWERLWGRSWIHLTDDILDAIPASYHSALNNEFHTASSARSSRAKTAKLLIVYIYLAHLVTPGTDEARRLAERISEIATCHVPYPDVVLGADFTEQIKRSDAEAFYPLVVQQGYLDSLLDYLKTGTAVTGIKEDPHISSPETVSNVATTLEISTDAAKYFLQLLTLTKPTDADVKKWNGWNKKQLEQAKQELLDKELVVTAKRTGTGRSVFLPGGWLDKSDTGPAMEVWKAPHYLLWKDAKCRPIVETCPPLVPYPELFTEVWERYKSGDIPGYEKLTTTRYRTKR
ncbi:hypothetical protein CMUST_10565 [Corynebacterium mustelae]|uniref:DNA-binding protein n=1 Tax=Corynebacterium mustelae TaxID=571915 RepID=A0A0G3GZ34_9CORY|nr:hypothetical protein [Corynebacterium mustelae]AKK06429.1 hypothetical protein CMUST_10565 [Corynebacterium mustelae]